MFKQIVSAPLIILALLSIYFGSYLPLSKSKRYIASIRTANQVRNLDEFKAHFDKVLKYYSPVGGEEVVKFLSSDILGMVSGQDQPEAIAKELASYIEPHLFKNNVRHQLTGAYIYQNLLNRFGRVEYYQKTEEHYLNAFRIGPKLPPVLYGLLNLYRMSGDKNKIKEIASAILSYWPDDKEVAALLEEVNK